MKILITGASGLVGSALVESLHGGGNTLRCLQRNKSHETADSLWNFEPSSAFSTEDSPIDAVIHLAGENVAAGRWTSSRKERILNSRVKGTRELVDYLSTLQVRPKTFLCASAIGFYGNRDDEILTENSGTGAGFLSEVCRQWESEANEARKLDIRVVTLRFGMVLSSKGGALHKMLPAFKAGLGGPIGAGNQYMSWISIDDLVSIVQFILNNDALQGPINVVSPEPITNKAFSKTLGDVVRRKAVLPAPPFALKLLFGDMAQEMLLASSRVRPEKLLQAGYSFLDRDLETTLRKCVKG